MDEDRPQGGRRRADGLHRLHAQAVTDPKAAELQRLLDKLICSYAHEADKLL